MTAIAAQPVAAEKSAARVWMVSPAFDLLFFVATGLVVLVPWFCIERLHVNPFYVVAGVAMASNGPHLMSTWTRVYLDGNERFRRPFHYWVMPAAIAFTTCWLVLHGGKSTIYTILFYWAFWHFMMQNWGILRIYQRRSGDVGSRMATLERVLLWLCGLWPLSHRLFTGPWYLFGSEIKHPDMPAWVVNGLLVLLVATATLYLAIRIVQWSRGERVVVIRPLFILAAWFGFFVPFVMIRNSGSAAFAAAACWHGLQYLGIVWFYNHNRWKGGIDKKARLVSWVSQPRRVPFYFLSLLAVAGVIYGALTLASKVVLDAPTWGAMVWLSMTFGHYYLDGVIWKLRKPEVSRQLITNSG